MFYIALQIIRAILIRGSDLSLLNGNLNITTTVARGCFAQLRGLSLQRISNLDHIRIQSCFLCSLLITEDQWLIC